jgi:hypothetical protein
MALVWIAVKSLGLAHAPGTFEARKARHSEGLHRKTEAGDGAVPCLQTGRRLPARTRVSPVGEIERLPIKPNAVLLGADIFRGVAPSAGPVARTLTLSARCKRSRAVSSNASG